jgi:hypothetical protein
MTTGDILKCLCKRATVEEILPDGSTIRLNMRNYYTDNGAGLDAKNVSVEEKKEEGVTEIPPIDHLIEDEKVPDAPSREAQVVETTKTEVDDNPIVDYCASDILEDDNEEDIDTPMSEEDASETNVVEETADVAQINKPSNNKKSSKKKKK